MAWNESYIFSLTDRATTLTAASNDWDATDDIATQYETGGLHDGPYIHISDATRLASPWVSLTTNYGITVTLVARIQQGTHVFESETPSGQGNFFLHRGGRGNDVGAMMGTPVAVPGFIDDGQWATYVVTLDAQLTARWYKNGVLVKQHVDMDVVDNGDVRFVIGNGIVMDVAAFVVQTRANDASEVFQMWSSLETFPLSASGISSVYLEMEGGGMMRLPRETGHVDVASITRCAVPADVRVVIENGTDVSQVVNGAGIVSVESPSDVTGVWIITKGCIGEFLISDGADAVAWIPVEPMVVPSSLIQSQVLDGSYALKKLQYIDPSIVLSVESEDGAVMQVSSANVNLNASSFVKSLRVLPWVRATTAVGTLPSGVVPISSTGVGGFAHIKTSQISARGENGMLVLTGNTINIDTKMMNTSNLIASHAVTAPIVEVYSANVVYRFVVGEDDNLCIEKHQPNGDVTLLSLLS